jgi:hypothetical protein
MTTETERTIKVGAILFENPLKEDTSVPMVTIVVSRRRLGEIQSKMGSAFIGSEGSIEKYRRLLTMGNNLANILMPGHVDFVLKEVLTPGQYQRALKANQEGKAIKFSKARN